MPALATPGRTALSFLAVSPREFSYRIYRKELGPTDLAVPGTRWLPRDISAPSDKHSDDGARYAVCTQEVDGYELVRIDAWVNPDLTVEIIHRALESKCRTGNLGSQVEYPEAGFTRKIGFVLARHDAGVREVIWVRAYNLKSLGRFGFLIKFSLRVPQDAGIPDSKRLELSLTHKAGRVNEDFYLDHYGKVEDFLGRYYPFVRHLHLHDGTLIEVEGKLSSVRSFLLSKRVFVFGNNKEGKSPFFGLKNHGPLRPADENAKQANLQRQYVQD